jgi:RNA polymerase sigma-70 factor, ECF subfamily
MSTTTGAAGLDALSDEDVLARFADASLPRSRREAAFHELVTRYRRRLFSVCVRVLRSPQDAEDAVQETFVRLARGAADFRGDAKVSTWLYRIARNVCTDHVRYDARRPSTPVDDVASVHDAPDVDELAARDTAMVLRDALAKLDEGSRTVLLLVAVDGLSYEEAAEATGLAVGTVKSRVSRARVRLGELLAASDPPARVTPTDTTAPADRPRRSSSPRGPPDRPEPRPRDRRPT